MPFFYKSETLSRENSYFAAANTARGFVSYFNENFKDKTRIIIKGGPGTGKSSMMARLAEKAKEKGYDPLFYYCSSDTDSLDAVLIPEKNTVILDGTPPHSEDPLYPGAKDELFDLGKCWNKDYLKSRKNEIAAISEKISSEYKDVYSLLTSAETIRETFFKTVLKYTDFEKIRQYSKKTLSKYVEKGRIAHRQTDALGTKGAVRFDTLSKNREIIFNIEDKYDVAGIFFEELKKLSEEEGSDFEYSLSPISEIICSAKIGNIIFTEAGKVSDKDRIFNTERFVDKSVKAEKAYLTNLKKTSRTLMREAFKKLSRIGILHSELESVYISSMDFDLLHKEEEKLTEYL